jgi:molecular chaperone DnaK
MTGMAEIAIGIDLGTSNSCVAARLGDAAEVLPNSYGERTTASVVFFQESGSISVGNAARANIIHDPTRTIASAKRLIGRYFGSEEVSKARAICSYNIVESESHGVAIEVGDERFTLPEISAMVLREMKTIAETQLGQLVTKAVITVPAYFNDNQRQATKDAGRVAGLEVLRILNEPTAAALAYGFGRGLNQRVAVWDLGGGTFDISILEIGNDVFEVLATCGDTFLGGDDFDDRLIDLLADEFLKKHGVNLRNDVYALERLKVAAEGAKQALSVDEEVAIRIPDVITGPDGEMLSVERTLTRSEYGKLVNDLIQRTFQVCDAALSQAGVVARDLDGVILVGGPTRLPLVRDAVSEYFQQSPKSDVDPDEVVAMGAAIHAASLLSPDTDAYLLDVTPLSLRVGVAGGLAETIIERNTPVPIEQTRKFTTFKDFQESVDIRVYQGESRKAEENELLGQFMFSGFEKGRRGEVSIDITFEINADGIVNVKAMDRRTGEQASAKITLSAGLSDGELGQIVDQGRTNRVETAALDPRQDTDPAEAQSDPGVLGTDSNDDFDLEANDDFELDADSDLAAGSDDDFDLDPNDDTGPIDVAEQAAVGADELISALDDGPTESSSTDEVDVKVPPDLAPADEELLPEPDDPPEFDWSDDEELVDIPTDPPAPGQVTAVDEDLEATDPTFDELDTPESEEDLFDQPGTDLSDSDAGSKTRS